MVRFLLFGLLLLIVSVLPVAAQGFDHTTWDGLLKKHVILLDGGEASAVDYHGMEKDREQLHQYLDTLEAVSRTAFDSWPATEQLAFLLNAYNGWTVEFILTRYPDLDSIKDLGSFFNSPWKKEFIPLLGETLSLDDIEHDLIRGSGRYNDPRIHFAVNCASVGCPALRAEAYRGPVLDGQLARATSLFLQDRSRNRLQGEVLQVSSIFRWYREDFSRGWLGIDSLAAFFLRHRDDLELSAAAVRKLESGELEIEYLDYDWSLNDVKRN